ncbi:MAG: caspase family protein [Cyanobacteria bacterium J06634_6]
MANYWAITIGINQYRHLQPLMHAQNDALFMHRFFTETVGIPADNCVLLSDLATSVGHQVVYPDKPALSEWVQTITQQVQPDDVLWFFFSGYGVQLEGADYLMPIDGDPGQIKETGLAAVNLIETLAQLPTQKTALVLDINRSQGSFAGQTIGAQVIELAQASGVPLLLSCQPEQYSHETFGVRHGLFTAALLEALHQKCTTLGQLDAYISKRLPELCEHHWRPIQNPVSLIAEAQQTTEIVPEGNLVKDVVSKEASSADLEGETALVGSASRSIADTNAEVSSEEVGNADGTTDNADQSTVLAGSTGTLLTTPAANADDSEKTRRLASRSGQVDRTPDSSAIVPISRESGTGDSTNGAKLRNWGLAALALLMIGVLLKQPFVRTAWQGLTARIAAVDGDAPSQTEATNESANTEEEEAAAQTGATTEAVTAVESLDDNSAESSTEQESEANESEPDEIEPEVPQSETDEASNQQDSGSPETEQLETAAAPTTADGSEAAATTDVSARTTALLAEANKALDARQYSEALITLQGVPKDERDSAFSSVLTRARAGAAEAQQFNASVLTEARTSIQPTQASQFTDAIAKARLIKPGEPYYEEAQQDIRSWSQIILDIAEGRATSGNLDGAIAAANVMPYDNPEFYQKAQNRIVFWQQRQNSRDIIVAAQAIPRSGQASSYQKGIVKLSEVPIEHPEYETAQRLSDEWSDRIFSIAQARAAQGRRRAAIQAAILVPAGTTAYEPAQQAIKRWQAE